MVPGPDGPVPSEADPPPDEVVAWDVADRHGRVGAVIRCRYCDGSGAVPEDHGQGRVEMLGCQGCRGEGSVHRPYPTGATTLARVFGLGAWDGVALDTFVYQLAGALSRVMLPDHEEMPSERIRETVDAFYARGPL